MGTRYGPKPSPSVLDEKLLGKDAAQRAADIAPTTTPYIIITGNPVDGFEYHGPFAEGLSDAIEWATDELQGLGWWTAPLAAPTESKPPVPDTCDERERDDYGDD